ncbi:hypothetical protein EBR61_03395 [bacterium]|nr:hypothetical protein [bacterium]
MSKQEFLKENNICFDVSREGKYHWCHVLGSNLDMLDNIIDDSWTQDMYCEHRNVKELDGENVYFVQWMSE